MSDVEPTKPVYLESVAREGSDTPERVVLYERVGKKVYVRAVDPCDDDQEPERVRIDDGDELIVMEHLSHITHHLTLEGDDGYLLPQRIVETSREPGMVVARTLRHGEVDDGRRVHVRPGDKIEVHPTLEIDAVDEFESQGVLGYAPISPVLWTWLKIAPQLTDDRPRYLLSAARRLDLAQTLFMRVEELRQSDPEGAPAVRRALFELVGATELAVVSLSRAIDMCTKAGTDIGVTTAVPSDITTRATAVIAIRNAYEHIEDRALGKVWGKPDPNALTIFDHVSIAVDGVIRYGVHQLDLGTDVPETISAIRQFLKTAASEALPPPDSPTTTTYVDA
ncbi:light-mediated development protein DET1 [Mycolicibacterium sp. CAU 1645]|uniref:Light-mediated development protein DET1 n=1 Tax=Mycolicibacterium arenosum TaxID=2952157 RepID=A0ABT1MFE5_9MYCO|nr:light-mediated development protein DET1 [Mycolicibacterium sp. CAU 1645]MCP9276929.1 light-mediated development protein DET1 [Mycolicibacterium sp. CAU 1645]